MSKRANPLRRASSLAPSSVVLIMTLQITLLNLDLTNPQPVPGGSAIGYWCEFESELTNGMAIFVPKTRNFQSYLEKPVSVELGHEAVSDFQVLPPQAERISQLTPLSTPGDFQADGKVVSLVWLDDEMVNAITEVMVGPVLFSLSSNETGDQELEYGLWVSFHIRRLILLEYGNQAEVHI